MNKVALAIITGTFLAIGGNAYAVDDAVKHPIETTKDKVRAERAEDRAEDQAKADYKAKKDEAEGTYKAAKDHCKELKGSEERACKKQAKADYDRRVADLKANYKAAKHDVEVAHDTRH
jgi:hypothetical protein